MTLIEVEDGGQIEWINARCIEKFHATTNPSKYGVVGADDRFLGVTPAGTFNPKDYTRKPSANA